MLFQTWEYSYRVREIMEMVSVNKFPSRARVFEYFKKNMDMITLNRMQNFSKTSYSKPGNSCKS